MSDSYFQNVLVRFLENNNQKKFDRFCITLIYMVLKIRIVSPVFHLSVMI